MPAKANQHEKHQGTLGSWSQRLPTPESPHPTTWPWPVMPAAQTGWNVGSTPLLPLDVALADCMVDRQGGVARRAQAEQQGLSDSL
jgi:hypothetical protein